MEWKMIFSSEHIVTIFITFFFAFALGLFARRSALVRQIIVDEEKKSIRGSFINFMFTVMLCVLIGIGSFKTIVAENLAKMEWLIVLIFGASWGIYSLKQGFTTYMENKPPNGK